MRRFAGVAVAGNAKPPEAIHMLLVLVAGPILGLTNDVVGPNAGESCDCVVTACR